MEKKLKAGVIGATGMVGQRFLTLLDNHPYFDVTCIAASARSAGKTYEEVMAGRWKLSAPMPEFVKKMVIYDASETEKVASLCDFVFCAVDMPKDAVKELEYAYAKAETPVVSNNSAHRFTPDVPMMVPEVNSQHAEIINDQRKRLGTKRGFIAVKPNCSIQSYVPLLAPLMDFEPTEVVVSTYQAISGAGKTFAEFPEIIDNVIPYIGGEEEKSEQEPLKVFGHIENGVIVNAKSPIISAQCYRVPVSDGHTASVFVNFKKEVTKEEIAFSLDAIQDPVSLQEPVYNEGSESIYIMDQVKDSKNTDELWAENLTIAEAMKKLNSREKSIISKRFFDGRTQMEVAEEIGISQAQVSRLEKNAIERIKKLYK